MLAAIALCLATTILLKMSLKNEVAGVPSATRNPWLAIITLVPLVWLLAVTFTAGIQKIGHNDPRIGFFAAAKGYMAKIAEAYPATGVARNDAGLAAAQKALPANKRLLFNNYLDAGVTMTFLALISVIVLLSAREWLLLITSRKPAVLRESEPVWLPDYAIAEGGRKLGGAAGAATLTLALARELSGEAQLARAQQQVAQCERSLAGEASTNDKVYVEVTEQRFNGVRRCC
jgi:carbon starvation protein